MSTELDNILGDLFVATHGGKTAHDIPGDLDSVDYSRASLAIEAYVAHRVETALRDRHNDMANQLDAIKFRMLKQLTNNIGGEKR